MKLGKMLLLLMATSIYSASLFSQILWTEDFNYASGSDLVGQGSWGISVANTNTVKVGTYGLRYLGYSGDNIGKSAALGKDRESVARAFSVTGLTNTLYVSFMVKVDSAAKNGSFLCDLDSDAGATAGFKYAELWVKDEPAGWRFGIMKNAIGVAPVYMSTTFTKADTQLIVIKYEVNSVSSFDDSVKLWVNPVLSASEPTRDVSIIDGAANDAAELRYFELVQDITTEADSLYGVIDGIRVGYTWLDAPLPVQFVSANATVSRLDVNLHWSTATETNNFGFEIERRGVSTGSTQATGASSVWEKVGFVQGGGTTTESRQYSFIDPAPEAGRYAYRIKQVDMSGAFTYYSAAEVEVGLAAKEFTLGPNYPNPFNPSTNITFTLPADGKAQLKVYNMLGQEVAVLFDGIAQGGKLYQKTFDASALPTGIYVSRLIYEGQSVTRKMLFVK